MAAPSGLPRSAPRHPEDNPATRDSPLVKWVIVGLALAFFALFLLLPLVIVFVEGFSKGWSAWSAALTDGDALAALRLTIIAAVIAVPLNLAFGVAAAWAIARFEFPGKQVLVTLIDLPFSVSPVIAGLTFVLLFGANGWFGVESSIDGSWSKNRSRGCAAAAPVSGADRHIDRLPAIIRLSPSSERLISSSPSCLNALLACHGSGILWNLLGVIRRLRLFDRRSVKAVNRIGTRVEHLK